MKRALSIVLVVVVGLYAVGCSQEVSQQDQIQKMAALKSAEQNSQAKDGIKSE